MTLVVVLMNVYRVLGIHKHYIFKGGHKVRNHKRNSIVVGQERAMNTISAPNHNAKCEEEDR